ncbi:MAG: hypothetical protein KY455_08490 [Euryarchaeota archaeon]|nr:hypothetical protein [Euryarchaeota archaeon]
MKTALFTIGLFAFAAFGATTVTADPNENALFGLCTAWNANEKGRENGNAANAPPFLWLQEQAKEADQTVEEYCSEVDHPSNNGGGNGGNGGGRP